MLNRPERLREGKTHQWIQQDLLSVSRVAAKTIRSSTTTELIDTIGGSSHHSSDRDQKSQLIGSIEIQESSLERSDSARMFENFPLT